MDSSYLLAAYTLHSSCLHTFPSTWSRMSNSFQNKKPIPKDFILGIFYKFQCGLCKVFCYAKSIRRLDIRSGEQIDVPPVTGTKVKKSNSIVCDHLLDCDFLPSFENFNILAYQNKKYLLEIKEILLIMRDKPSLNRNNSLFLYLKSCCEYDLIINRHNQKRRNVMENRR